MSEEHALEHETDKHALCTEQGCNETALYAFTWDWGESGYCCGMHAVTIRHRSLALGRVATLTALRPGAVSPVTQDERIQMHARVLAAEDTVVEIKRRNSDLFEANKELTAEIRRLRIEVSQLTSQVQDARAEAAQLTGEKMAAVKQLAETNHELARLEGVVRASEVGAA
jgi:septal ring factor EnvC (AmiA/AmiB activator)